MPHQAHENVGAVCKYVVAQIDNDDFRRGTVYYRSPLMFAHAFSRAYREGNVKCLEPAVSKIREATLSLQNAGGSWGNDLETAFGALALIVPLSPLPRGVYFKRRMSREEALLRHIDLDVTQRGRQNDDAIRSASAALAAYGDVRILDRTSGCLNLYPNGCRRSLRQHLHTCQ